MTMQMSLIAQKTTPEQYIADYKDVAMTEMVKYKIPASITLAQGIFESGSGNSKLATEGNNHFGIKCHSDWTGKTMKVDDDKKNECFRVYSSAADSYRDHSIFLKNGKRYSFLFDLKITDYKGWANGLKKAGYATSPTYAKLIINLIERYDLTQYDRMVVNGKFKEKSKEKAEKEQDNKVNGAEPTLSKLTSNKPSGRLANGRSIYKNNKVKYVIAKENENIYSLAKDCEIYDYQIIKYNCIGKRTNLRDGEIIYITKKRRKADKSHPYHIINKGETLSYVSQLYAVKLESIYKMNDLNENSILQIGQRIRLR